MCCRCFHQLTYANAAEDSLRIFRCAQALLSAEANPDYSTRVLTSNAEKCRPPLHVICKSKQTLLSLFVRGIRSCSNIVTLKRKTLTKKS